MSNITIDQLGSAITAQLDTFAGDVREAVRKAVDESMTEMVKETKSTAQVRTGRYKRTIAATTKDDTTMTYSKVWHAKRPGYQVAHLLNNGHRFRDGGSYGGSQHVTNAANRAFETFQRKLGEGIRNAGS